MKLGGGVAMTAALALAGCAPDYVTGSSAPVLLVITSINGGTPIASDVRGDDGVITNCFTVVGVSETVKNPGDIEGSVSENVTVSRYDVAFRRADGRAVEGVDVPYRFSGSMTFSLKPGDDTSFTIDLVRQQAKLEPPLSNITGLQLVEMTADVTVYGQTLAGQSVSATGSADVRFADYGTGTTSCESGS